MCNAQCKCNQQQNRSKQAPVAVPVFTEGEGRVLELRRLAAFGFGLVDTVRG